MREKERERERERGREGERERGPPRESGELVRVALGSRSVLRRLSDLSIFEVLHHKPKSHFHSRILVAKVLLSGTKPT